MTIKYNLIAVLGHTAGGKTRFAARLASRLGGEIISADSRQVYRHMDIGTGKDYEDYRVGDKQVPFHLVDIVDPGYEYNLFEYQKDFLRVFDEITGRQALPVLCGGSGLYIEAILRGYQLIRVPVNPELRIELENKSMEELAVILDSFKNPHNTSDTKIRKRLIRALEIEYYYRDNPGLDSGYPALNPLLVGIMYDRNTRRERISLRLKNRLEEGLIEEVENLLHTGITAEQLIYYGLEYKYITLYLKDKLSYEEMYGQLNTAIHQFSKRQLTWFRRMERNGMKIHWLDGNISDEEKLERTLGLL